MAQYLIANGAMPTTAALASVATGTAIKTLLQVCPGTNSGGAKIKRWGISFDGSSAATPGKVELIQTDVAATVTAHVANGIMKYDWQAVLGPSDPTTSLISVGTAATGYTASAEGTTTASRIFDLQLIAPTSQYVFAFELGVEPAIEAGKFARIRVTFGASVNAYTWMIVEV